MDQFLAELNISGERSHFAVDWARAQEKMGAHLDLEARDYACHLAQLAYHLGASQLQLSVSGDWLEWTCDGRELDEAKMRATAAGELLMAELDLCLNFCLQSLLLSDYVEKLFCSGGWQLHHHGAGWKLRQSRTMGTRLQLRVAWKHRLRNFLSSHWWRKLPELEALHGRLSASPLTLYTPQALPRPVLATVLGVRGKSPLSQYPPVEAKTIVRLEYPWLSGSFWLAFSGHECHILCQGLAFPSQPFVPGCLWLSLGEPGTDLGRRQLVLNADFQLARSQFLRQLSRHFGEWLEQPELLAAGVRSWLLGCLLTMADLEGGAFRETLLTLPLLQTLCHGHLSLLQVDQQIPVHGCPVVPELLLEELEDKPFMLVAQEARLLAFLRLRYGEAVRSGEERLERLRRWRTGPVLRLESLLSFENHWPVELDGWRGRVAFDASGSFTRLDCYRRGRRMFELGPPPGLVRGFWVMADHPELEADGDWIRPLENEVWNALLSWLRNNQVVWLAEVFSRTELPDRFELMERVLATDGVTLGPLLKVELWPGLNLQQWLADGQRHDLRRWIDAGVEISDAMRFMLAKSIGHGSADEALSLAAHYGQRLQAWRNQPEESPRLPAGALVEVAGDCLLGLGDHAGVRLRLYRQGRLLVEQTLDQVYGLPDGLMVGADHEHFRITLRHSLLDLECQGYPQLLLAIRATLPRLLEIALQSGQNKVRSYSLTALEGLSGREWPLQVPFLERLDGTAVTLEQVRLALEPRVLVAAAARVVLPGFESCWCLAPKERDWLERVLQLHCLDVTRDYNEAYRVSCYENEPGGRVVEEAPPPWRDPQQFQQGSLRAEAGLVPGPGPSHLCETTFYRGGKPAMRCPLRLATGQGREAEEKLVCRVDWEEIPFVENYSQLLALPLIAALAEWLRGYAFEPPLPCCDFQLARLELDAGLHHAPIFRRYQGGAWSLKQLPTEVVYGLEDTGPDEALRLSLATLDGLRRLLFEHSLRHWSEPAPDAAMKRVLLRQQPRQLRLPKAAYALEGHQPLWSWGVAWTLTGGSEVRVLYQGRPAGVIKPDWDLEVAAEIMVDDVRLTATGEIRLVGEVDDILAVLLEEIRSKVLRDLPESARLRLALCWLQRERVPDWGQDLPDLKRVLEWWCLPEPRPFVFGQETIEGALLLSPAVVGWAELQGIKLRNCTNKAEALARAEICRRPEAEFAVSGPGFFLSAERGARQSVVREVCDGRVLEEQLHVSFPPYYLERQDQQRLPQEAFEQLFAWWREQLFDPPERLSWLAEMDSLLEDAEPGAEFLVSEARARLRWLQELNQDEWCLLRRGLEMLGSQPIRLILVEEGPLLHIQGQTARLNRHLASPPTRPRTAALLSLAAHDRPTLYSVPHILAMLQKQS